uniref:Uncharacterized protein n=1 Tax=Anguilla anguilla TaxID=7936 RepID=A0A0E9W2T3_ANGAN
MLKHRFIQKCLQPLVTSNTDYHVSMCAATEK